MVYCIWRSKVGILAIHHRPSVSHFSLICLLKGSTCQFSEFFWFATKPAGQVSRDIYGKSLKML